MKSSSFPSRNSVAENRKPHGSRLARDGEVPSFVKAHMGSLLTPAISVGPIVFGLGLLAAIGCCAVFLFTPRQSKGAMLLRYLLVVFAVGVASFAAGAAIGIALFCTNAGSGNLCGLGGVFGVGPLLSGISIAGYSFHWVRKMRNAE